MDEHAGGALLDDLDIAPSRRHEGVPYAGYGGTVASRESDPAVMLATVLLAMANTVVLAAVVAAVAWIFT